jgi:drug/metabolite transporter (DMT)-like permease
MNKKALVIIGLFFAILMWSISYPIIKIGLEEMSPLTLATLRQIIIIPMFTVLLAVKRKEALSYSKEIWFIFIGAAVFSIVLPNIFQNIGMQYTSASTSSIIQSSSPIFTIFLAIILLNEKPALNKILGATIAFIGTILLVTGGKLVLTGMLHGNILVLLSAISYAVAGVIVKKALAKVSPFILINIETMIGFIILFFVTIFVEPINIFDLSLKAWIVILLLSIFPNFVAILIWYRVLRVTELSKLINLVYLMPIITIIFSYYMLHEVITLQTIILAIIVIFGVALSQRDKDIISIKKSFT